MTETIEIEGLGKISKPYFTMPNCENPQLIVNRSATKVLFEGGILVRQKRTLSLEQIKDIARMYRANLTANNLHNFINLAICGNAFDKHKYYRYDDAEMQNLFESETEDVLYSKLRKVRHISKENPLRFRFDCMEKLVEECSETYVYYGGRVYYLYMLVGCGHCELCQNSKKFSFTNKCDIYTLFSENRCAFVTLTYGNWALPLDTLGMRRGLPTGCTQSVGYLCPSDIQKFFKRLRAYWEKRIYPYRMTINPTYMKVGEKDGVAIEKEDYVLKLEGQPLKDEQGNLLYWKHFKLDGKHATRKHKVYGRIDKYTRMPNPAFNKIYDYRYYDFKYSWVGEYGSKTKRPHYHVMMWGYPLPVTGSESTWMPFVDQLQKDVNVCWCGTDNFIDVRSCDGRKQNTNGAPFQQALGMAGTYHALNASDRKNNASQRIYVVEGSEMLAHNPVEIARDCGKYLAKYIGKDICSDGKPLYKGSSVGMAKPLQALLEKNNYSNCTYDGLHLYDKWNGKDRVIPYSHYVLQALFRSRSYVDTRYNTSNQLLFMADSLMRSMQTAFDFMSNYQFVAKYMELGEFRCGMQILPNEALKKIAEFEAFYLPTLKNEVCRFLRILEDNWDMVSCLPFAKQADLSALHDKYCDLEKQLLFSEYQTRPDKGDVYYNKLQCFNYDWFYKNKPIFIQINNGQREEEEHNVPLSVRTTPKLISLPKYTDQWINNLYNYVKLVSQFDLSRMDLLTDYRCKTFIDARNRYSQLLQKHGMLEQAVALNGGRLADKMCVNVAKPSHLGSFNELVGKSRENIALYREAPLHLEKDTYVRFDKRQNLYIPYRLTISDNVVALRKGAISDYVIDDARFKGKGRIKLNGELYQFMLDNELVKNTGEALDDMLIECPMRIGVRQGMLDVIQSMRKYRAYYAHQRDIDLVSVGHRQNLLDKLSNNGQPLVCKTWRDNVFLKSKKSRERESSRRTKDAI